jgi:alpha-methylacyl-CoA racemase
MLPSVGATSGTPSAGTPLAGTPLAGTRVLDFSRLAPGPYCSMLLVDFGAEVLRIDRAPLGVEMPPFDGDVLGRGKRSIALDLKQPAGVEIARQLATRADVVLEGFRPGVMERLGLGPDDLLALNPGVVYARITGWGQDGPMADRAGHDIDYVALSGVLGAIGRDGSPPVPPINLLADFAGGGLLCAFGVVLALLERERSGTGQVIDAAMIDGAMNLMSVFAVAIHEGRWGPHGTNIVDTGAHFCETYETADGRYMAVGAMEPQFYAQFLEGLGLADESLPDQMDQATWPAMKQRVAAIIATRTRDEWCAVFDDRDACVVPVLAPAEAPHHPHNAARDAFLPRHDGALVPAPAPRFSRTPATIAGPPPEIGVHTRDVLEELGYEPTEIERLAQDGTVAWP